MRLRGQVELVRSFFSEFVRCRRAGESVYAVERLAHLVIQSILDFAAMVSVYRGLRKPETYRGLAGLLAGELGLDQALSRFLSQLAGFRNILVHGYAGLNRELEEQAFREMEQRLPTVIEALEGYVRGLSIDPPEGIIGGRLIEVFREAGVRFAFLFGSRARVGSGRDYDIAVSMRLRSALELGGLLVRVAEALGVGEWEVDIVHLETAPLSLIYTVLVEGTLIYGSPEEAYGFLIQKYLQLLDVETLYRLYVKQRSSK